MILVVLCISSWILFILIWCSLNVCINNYVSGLCGDVVITPLLILALLLVAVGGVW